MKNENFPALQEAIVIIRCNEIILTFRLSRRLSRRIARLSPKATVIRRIFCFLFPVRDPHPLENSDPFLSFKKGTICSCPMVH